MRSLLRLGVGPVGDIQTVALAGSGGGGASNYSTTTIVTSGSQATIHFATISQAFKQARITLVGRDTASGTGDANPHLMINGDATSGNYTSASFVSGSGSAPAGGALAASAAGGVCGNIPGSSGNANAVGVTVITIANYSGAVFQKIVQVSDSENFGASPTVQRAILTFTWKSNAAITDLLITAGVTAFVDGTTATLELFG